MSAVETAGAPAGFERVCALSDLTPGQAAQAEVGGEMLAIVRTDESDGKGEVFAVSDTCSHGAVSLSEGEVDGCTLECWLHGSQFDLRSGRPLTPPAITPIAVYPVKIEGDDVYVSLSPTTES
ncbi:non-heme iron oxygenase ferredoxin subunit [Agilicoccus flavus]|uniref:non-heme iron oxygenase ferredoxin subunit n=1 Tax=Agilicoccus flavus TaxID=2775968 RepID=UPI001CF6E05A|nr:non-heme iron oxygenase ferredoxin subunit [Agilicoccus flavus]